MTAIMRCLFCGLLQDEPSGIKECQRCGGELIFESPIDETQPGFYLEAQMELDQINAPASQTVDRHLLISLRTPEKVPPEFLAKAESGRPALSFNVIVDVSGSMHGEKIMNTKQALHMATRLLHEDDNLAMTAFSDEARLFMKPSPFNQTTKIAFSGLVDELRPGGGTALYSGLDLGLQQANNMRTENNLTLLLSDGQANVGETDLEVVGMLAKEAARMGLVVSTLGVGMDYNEALMTEIATQGQGRFYHVQSPNEIVPYLTGELGEAADLAARDVKIHIRLPKGAALIPLSAAYTCEIAGGVATVSIGDIPADLDVEIPLRLTLFSGKANNRLEVEGEITFLTPSGSTLKAPLNRVTVRFVKQNLFETQTGVVKPVAARIAKQMYARQVLGFSRAFTRRNETEIRAVEEERVRFNQYVELLDEDLKKELTQQIDSDFQSVRSASPMAKNVVSNAFMTSRSMRGPKNKK